VSKKNFLVVLHFENIKKIRNFGDGSGRGLKQFKK